MENYLNNPWIIGLGVAVIVGEVSTIGRYLFYIGKQEDKGTVSR